MRKLLVLFLSFQFFAAQAQSNIEDIDLAQSIFGKEKKMIVSDFVTLGDEAMKGTFWNLYDEYEGKRKELGKQRIALLEKYVSNYMTLDDATISGILKETIKLTAQNDKLIATYARKLEKSVGVKPAAQFFELESYILSAIRSSILENIPFIGELD